MMPIFFPLSPTQNLFRISNSLIQGDFRRKEKIRKDFSGIWPPDLLISDPSLATDSSSAIRNLLGGMPTLVVGMPPISPQ
jgi:hypothetical protein